VNFGGSDSEQIDTNPVYVKDWGAEGVRIEVGQSASRRDDVNKDVNASAKRRGRS